jgi:hypothetical protein
MLERRRFQFPLTPLLEQRDARPQQASQPCPTEWEMKDVENPVLALEESLRQHNKSG